ncbi:MAG TPA: peptide chain release factor N(5)-glutamine methyltransferase [Patescibacteria group bacterium]
MPKISDIQKEYRGKIDQFDLELLLCHALGKSRVFILAHPEYEIPSLKIRNLKLKIARRAKGEPVAYLIGHREFYGLDFKVNKHTLIPRPETELMVEQVLDLLRSELRSNVVVDIGTGSGCIIISIAHGSKNDAGYFATDISANALKVARKNAEAHNLDKKIKFLHGSLLEPLLKSKSYKLTAKSLVVTANLPYLSKEIYESAPRDVLDFEPKSALYSNKAGLAHYEKLLKQIHQLLVTDYELRVTAFLEISPEQKQPISRLIKSILPEAETSFTKDLAGKWRICKIKI